MNLIKDIFLESNLLLKNKFFIIFFNFLIHIFLIFASYIFLGPLILNSNILISTFPLLFMITLYISFININLKIIREEKIKFTDVFFINFNIFKIYISIFILSIVTPLMFVLIEVFLGLKGFFNFFFPILFYLASLIYSQFYYVLLDLKPKGLNIGLGYSRELLKGHFGEFILIEVFLKLLNIPILLSFGLLSFWIIPLTYIARTKFYIYLLENSELVSLKDEEIINDISNEELDFFQYED